MSKPLIKYGALEDMGKPGLQRCFIPGDTERVAAILGKSLRTSFLLSSGLPRKHIILDDFHGRATMWVKEGNAEQGLIEGEVFTPTPSYVEFSLKRPITKG